MAEIYSKPPGSFVKQITSAGFSLRQGGSAKEFGKEFGRESGNGRAAAGLVTGTGW
jgi:hypothetical protein